MLMMVMTGPLASADEVSGTSWAVTPNLEDDSGLELDRGANILVNWKVWTLYDEPVVDSTAAWSVWAGTSIRSLPSWVKRYKGSLEIPQEVLRKIRVFNVELFGEVWSREGLILDPGVFTRPMIHAEGLSGIETVDWKSFMNSPPDNQAESFSFNVPGGKSWATLFLTESGGQTVLGAKTEEAKAMVKQGFNLGTYDNELKILKMGVDLSAVHDWLWQKEREAVETWEAEIIQEKTRLAEQDAERKRAEESDFWGTPANTETVEDRAVRQTLEWELELIEERNRELDGIKTAIEIETSKVDMIIEAKAKAFKETDLAMFSIKGNLHPFRDDSGLYGYRDDSGTVVIKPQFDHAFDFSEGRAAVRDKTGKYGFINIRGDLAIPCKYYYATSFHDGYACVEPVKPPYITLCLEEHYDLSNWNRRGLIDKDENVIIPPKYYSIQYEVDSWYTFEIVDSKQETVFLPQQVGGEVYNAERWGITLLVQRRKVLENGKIGNVEHTYWEDAYYEVLK
jgi:hypothetical protein